MGIDIRWMSREDEDELEHLLDWWLEDATAWSAVSDFATQAGSGSTRAYINSVADRYDAEAETAEEDGYTAEAKGWRRYALRLRALARRI